jgi:hypothetical protein
MGRPPEANPRCHQLNISLTRDEFAVVATRAAAAQMRIVEYSRLVLLSKHGIVAPAPVAQIDRLAYEQLKRLGNNLNQIARHLNKHGGGAPASLAVLLEDIRTVLNRGRDA